MPEKLVSMANTWVLDRSDNNCRNRQMLKPSRADTAETQRHRTITVLQQSAHSEQRTDFQARPRGKFLGRVTIIDPQNPHYNRSRGLVVGDIHILCRAEMR